ncbi:hypothetical protein BGX27_010808 [Mortierella sp. AM989]|nr:hypothetical protein BGX27_010808 [Mortierella sp. AM989]
MDLSPRQKTGIKIAVGVTSAVAAPFAVVGIVGAIGFGAGGIVAGSWAAGFMASYGGTVAAGSACAVLQSVGAAGLGMAGTTAVCGAGAAVGVVVSSAGIDSVEGEKKENNGTSGDSTSESDGEAEDGTIEELKTSPLPEPANISETRKIRMEVKLPMRDVGVSFEHFTTRDITIK